MSRKLIITLLTALLMAGLAVQAVAEEYGYTKLASTLVNGRAASMVLNGTTGYVLDGYGVTALNVTNPASPTVLGKVATYGFSYSGALVGDNLYVADGYGLSVVNVTNPAQMNASSFISFTGSCRSVAAISGWAFCAVEGAGLVVVNTNTMAIQTTLALTGTPYWVTLATIGGTQYAFVAMGSNGLAIVNVSNPASPTLAGTADTPGTATGVAVATTQNIAVLADGASGVAFVDVANPSAPVYQQNVNTQTTAVHVAIGGQNAVVTENSPTAAGGAIQFFNFSAALQGTYNITTGSPTSTEVSGNTAYVSEDGAGVEIVNITTPSNPTHLGQALEPGGSPVSAIKQGNYAYVARKEAGLSVVDMTNLHSPNVIRTFWTGGECYDQFYFDNKVYTIDFNGNLVVINVTNPAAPESLSTNPGSWLPVAGARSMAFDQVSGQPYFFVGYYHNTQGYSVVSYDLVNSSAPQIHSTINLGNLIDVKGITLVNNRLFVSATTVAASDTLRGVYIYDVTTPAAAPVYLGHLRTTGNARMTAVNGNTMYVAAEAQGLLVVDITTPANPTIVATYNNFQGQPAYGVTLVPGEQRIFVAHLGSGVTALDVTTPATPAAFGHRDTPGLAYEPIMWDATHLLVADSYSLEVDSLGVVGIISHPGTTTTPKTFTLYGASPNPFNSSTMITFALPVAGKVDVTVFDMMGRQVANAFSGNLQAGEHHVSFDGQDLSSGIYLLKVSTRQGVQATKMVLLK